MKRAFVLMPSGLRGEYEGGEREADYVFTEIISPAVSSVSAQIRYEISIHREIDKRTSGSITAAIIKSIVSSEIVIVDITGSNPNVFLELGIRYSLRNKGTILIGQFDSPIPFDISSYRCIKYDKFLPAKARNEIQSAILNILSEESQSDSVVFDVFRDMRVHIPGISNAFGEKSSKMSKVMPWEDYMEKIEYHCNYLKEPTSTERRFPLDAIIGITNGGLVAADLIAKGIVSRVPVLSLWARRHRKPDKDSSSWYFDNKFNECTLGSIKTDEGKTKEPTGLLVVDDHMGSGQTSLQAIKYLQKTIGNHLKIIFIPLICRRHQNLGLVEEFLPYNVELSDGSKLQTSQVAFKNITDTSYEFLPYFYKTINVGSTGL